MSVISRIGDALWGFIAAGLPRKHDPDILRRTIIVNLMLFFAGLFLLLLGLVAYRQGDVTLGMADHGMLFIVVSLLLLLRYNRRLELVATVATTLTGSFFLFLMSHGGVDKSAFMWLMIFPVIAVIVMGVKWGSVFTLGAFVIALGIFFIGRRIPQVAEYNMHLGIRMAAAYLVMFLFTVLIDASRLAFQGRLRAVNSRMDDYAQKLAAVNEERQAIIGDLEGALAQVKTLQGLLPICSDCKKIRDDDGFWNELELYISDHTETVLSHGICPDCAQELYGEFLDEVKKRQTGNFTQRT